MEYINLGETDLKISRLGLGTWAIGGFGWGKINDDDSIAAIRRAWDSGINFFDTADIYGLGHAEEILAKALGEKRRQAVIATKFGVRLGKDGKTFKDISPKYAKAALEASLRRLKIDCVPLYQIHWPDGITAMEEIMAALLKMQEQGKIRHIGYSNFTPKMIEAAQSVGRGESLQSPYNLINREAEKELMPVCEKKSITFIAYGPLAQGLLSGKISVADKFDLNDIRARDPNWQGEIFKKNLARVGILKKIGEQHKKTAAQTAIRWVLDNNRRGAVLAGATCPEHILENVKAMDWRLSSGDMKELQKS